jgi:predicted unusual protein kinase regulating ubiquinone biosynthesis (AarF/ABC1/UbiB family)
VAGPVRLVTALDDATPLVDVHEQRRLRRSGDDILRLYFAQWLVSPGIFIDLRLARFGVDDAGLLYTPNGLWIQLRPEFREGMIALYRSFYSSDDEAFDKALRQMGMLRGDLSPAAEQELKALLFQHFGIDQRSQRFSIDEFKASFDELFAFFVSHDYKLHSDFVFVGFYLITLYLTLEQLGQSHNVRKICAEVLLGPGASR